MNDLKPCPFCGYKGVEILADDNKYLYYRYFSQCQRCGAGAKRGHTKEDAAKEWNRRAKAVSLHDIDRVIAGHSYYHGDCILAALTCIAEGKEVNPVRPADVAPVVHGRWVTHYRSGTPVAEGYVSTCCDMWNNRKSDYCPNCGAKMDGGADHEAD